MVNYTIRFNNSNTVTEKQFDNDTDAQIWVESLLSSEGYDADSLVAGDWDSDGVNDDGEPCERMLFWASESDAEGDNGANSICQLCVAR